MEKCFGRLLTIHNGDYIHRLVEQGLNAKDIVGYHGTSLEALEYLREHGVLPPGRVIVAGEAITDSIYFAPVPSKFPKMPPLSKHDKGDDPREKAAGYAEQKAEQHYIVKALGLDLGDPEHRDRAANLQDFSDPDRFQYFLARGISRERIDQVMKEALARKGVVLALGNKIQHFSIQPGDGDPAAPRDYRIVIPARKTGLPLTTIVGVEPRGQYEWDQLTNEGPRPSPGTP